MKKYRASFLLHFFLNVDPDPALYNCGVTFEADPDNFAADPKYFEADPNLVEADPDLQIQNAAYRYLNLAH